MDLRSRPLEPRDLRACSRLLRGGLAYPAATLAQLEAFWTRLLGDAALSSAVIESPGLGRPSQLAFGASVFVTDEYMRAARSAAEPYLTARTVALEFTGRSPILRPAAVRRASAGDGLNVLLVHYGEDRERLAPEQRAEVRYKMHETFLASHRGYKIKEILQEFWDEIELPFILNGWGAVRSDYGEYFRSRGLVSPAPERRPYLVGFTRKEARADPGNMSSPLFLYTPPRLAFSRAEQALLARALLGETDEQLARSLNLAMPTVKGRWRRIYARVAAASPELLPESADLPERVRGREKRRRLLEYLRRHQEELRDRPRRHRAQSSTGRARGSY
jgi:DNA-binding CsgD family transcriptional regulator